MRRIQQLRIDAHLSRDELAAKAGVSAEQIRSFEIGETANPRVQTLVALAGVLKVKPSELLMDAIGPTEAAA